MTSPARPALLYVTDLQYQAWGRRYGDEDTYLSGRLRDEFVVGLCHPLDAVALMDGFDAVVVRNTGPVLGFQPGYDAFRAAALERGTRVFNSLTGKADMVGKQYLVDLSAQGYPVIPTVNGRDLGRLPEAAEYVVKPRLGADSIGLRFVTRGELGDAVSAEVLVQPRVDLRYEVSFYLLGRAFQYALYAPSPDRRWALERYHPDATDLAFVQTFVDWNDIEHGIQRVDACRTADGQLLLVELEDLNPYLSLELLDAATRDTFVQHMTASLHSLVQK